jgi:dihydropteroate synthase
MITPIQLDCAGQVIDLTMPKIMGVLNVTPDSFSDGGCYQTIDAAVERAQQMVDEGAAIIDVGAESTRPGAKPLSIDAELARLLPVVKALRTQLPVPISVDTRQPEVMQAAIDLGVGMINAVDALSLPGAIEVVARSNVAVCLMHMRGEPATMQQHGIAYDDVLLEITDYLQSRIDCCLAAGMDRSRLVVDPGFGFGKNIRHNCCIIRELERLSVLNCPVLLGCSRKSTIGHIVDKPVDQRLYGSLAGAVLAARHGANIIRVHDVAATQEALLVTNAIMAS